MHVVMESGLSGMYWRFVLYLGFLDARGNGLWPIGYFLDICCILVVATGLKGLSSRHVAFYLLAGAGDACRVVYYLRTALLDMLRYAQAFLKKKVLMDMGQKPETTSKLFKKI